MARVTAETMQMQQYLELYRTSDDAGVVRAAMVVLHGSPGIIAIHEPSKLELRDAIARCVSVWNAGHGGDE